MEDREKSARRLANTLTRYRAAPGPGAFRDRLGQGLSPEGLLAPEGLALVQAELRLLKQERRALRRIEAVLLGALGVAPQGDDDEDGEA